MNYKEFIDNILTTRGRFACGDEYKEKHHIVPKCMGGTNDKNNLIDLYAREHFEAHRLLALENPNIKGLTYAWWAMAHLNASNQSRYELLPEEYEEAKMLISKIHSEYQKKRMSSPELRKKISDSLKGRYVGEKNPNYGKHHSKEAKEKISMSNKGRFSGNKNYFYGIHMCGKNNPFYGKHHSEESKRKMSEKRKRHWYISDETKKRFSEMYKGEGNPNYGKHHSDESKRKISESSKKLWQDKEFRVKVIEHHKKMYKGEGNPNSKMTLQYDKNMNLIKIFRFKKQASDELNINSNSISMCCLNKRLTAGGYKWKYLYDQTKRDGTIIQGAISLGLITEEYALKMLKEQNSKTLKERHINEHR